MERYFELSKRITNSLKNTSYYMYALFFIWLYLSFKQGIWKAVFINIYQYLSIYKYKLGLIIIITIILFIYFDKLFAKLFRNNNSYFVRATGKIGFTIGKGEVLNSILLTLFYISFVLNYKEINRLFSISMCLSVSSGLICNIIKAIISRKRPQNENKPFKFFSYKEAYRKRRLFRFEFLSMPSGHTTSITAAAVPFFLFYHNLIFRIFLILIIILVGFARFCKNKHWLTDILVGIIIGTYLGYVGYNVFIYV